MFKSSILNGHNNYEEISSTSRLARKESDRITFTLAEIVERQLPTNTQAYMFVYVRADERDRVLKEVE